MNYQTILTGLTDGIFTITINRPDKMNALNRTVMEELDRAVQEVYRDPAIKSVLLTGAGDKAFVAGADISEFLQLNAGEGSALSRKGQQLFSSIENCPKPFIAAVNGYALGGGCELAMACHFRIAGENAKFGQPEVNLGLIPGYGGTQRLVSLLGKGKALELMMTGDMLSASEAWRYGLVNYVVPDGELPGKCKALLQKIQSRAPLAVAKIIASVNAYYDKTADGFATEAEEFGRCFATEDMKEGAAAFLEKRKPQFKGK